MESYHPVTAPDPKTWLKLDEGERILLVSGYHEQAGEELPNVQMHIDIHVVVENQSAEAYLPAVEALARLRRDGLSRHDAVHAIGSVLAEHLWTQAKGGSVAVPPQSTSKSCGYSLRRVGVSITATRKKYIASQGFLLT